MDNREHAIAIARVSSGKQREEDQRPGLTAYAARKGYVLDGMVPIHGRSAFHGRHVTQVLAAVDEHVKRGLATVVIFRHVDRSHRQGVFEGYDLIKKIMEAGARVEFSEEEHLNDKPELLGLYFDMGFRESKVKSARKLQGNNVRSLNGKLNGLAPWGYDSVDGLLVPNALGREWIPRIYQMSADGRPIRAIGLALKEAGIRTSRGKELWSDDSIRRLIGSPSYMGERVGKGEMEYEALVPRELWQQANAAMKDRYKWGRGPAAQGRETALLKPWCGECYGVIRDGAPSGKSAMYKTYSETGRAYYGCKGHGPQRHSCGVAKLVPCDELESLVLGFMALDITPHTTTIYHPAVDNEDAIKEVSRLIRKADAEGDDSRMEELVAMRKGLRLLPLTAAWKEEKDTGMTRAQYFQTLDHEGRRELLAKIPFRARKRDGVTQFGLENEDGSVNWISKKP